MLNRVSTAEFDTIASMNERIKKVIMIIVAALASGFFLFQGFSLLFQEQAKQEQHSDGNSPTSPH